MIAGLLSHRGASAAILALAEHGFVEAVLPLAAVEQIRRNLERLVPAALPAFEEFLTLPGFVVHEPTDADVAQARALAHAGDVSIAAAALGSRATLLVTHNVRHFRSSARLGVRRPREFVAEFRASLGSVGAS